MRKFNDEIKCPEKKVDFFQRKQLLETKLLLKTGEVSMKAKKIEVGVGKGIFSALMVLMFLGLAITGFAENLVGNPSFEDDSYWTTGHTAGDYEGEYDNTIAHTGERSYKIRLTGEVGTTNIYSQIISVTPFNMENKNVYNISIFLKGEGGKPRVCVVYYRESGNSWEYLPSIKTGIFDWKEYNWRLLVPEETTSLRIYLLNSFGTAWFDDVCLEESTLTTEEEAKLKEYEGNYYLYQPRYKESDPDLESGHSGFIVYKRKNPRFMYENSVPQPEEMVSDINVFATPGQSVPFWTSVYAVDNDFNISVELESDFTDGQGHLIAKEQVKIKYIKTWEQRNQRVSGDWCGRYYNIPERLLPVTEAVSVAQGQNQGFWFQVPVPSDCYPGEYQAMVKFSANGIEKSIQVKLKVLPFKLKEPDNLCHLFASIERIDTMTDAQAERYLKDMKECGVSDLEYRLLPFVEVSDWWSSTWSGDYKKEIGTEEKYSGNRSVKIECTGTTGRAAWYSGAISGVEENTVYDLSLYIKGNSLTNAKMWIACDDSTGAGIESKYFSLSSGTYDWTEFSGIFTTPPGTTSIRVYLENHGEGSIWFDDVFITQGAAQNIVPNPGFEGGSYFTLTNGEITGWHSDRIARFLTLKKNIGFKGRLVGCCDTRLEIDVGNELGIEVDSYNGPFSEMNNEILKQGFKDALVAIDNFIKLYAGAEDYEEWFYYGADEPHNSDDRMERAQWEYSLAKEAGMKTCGTVYYNWAVEELGQYLDMCYSGWGGINEEFNTDLRFLFSQQGPNPNGIEWYYYGATTGVEGDLIENRFGSGFFLEKTEAKGNCAVWTYCYPKGDPFDDFDSTGKDQCITYPAEVLTDDRVIDSTLQWEGMREGLYDYRYIYTLKYYIQWAEKVGYTNIADNAQNVLDNIIDNIPWLLEHDKGNCYMQPGNYTNEMLQQDRLALAEQIEIIHEPYMKYKAAYWKFDEGSGATAHDSSGNGNDGTLMYMDPDTCWVDGKIGKALEFDGMDDYVICGSNNIVGGFGEISAEIWVFPTADNTNILYANSNALILHLHTSASPGFYLKGEDGTTSGYINYKSGAIKLNDWNHITATWDGSKMRLYVNAELQGEKDFNGGSTGRLAGGNIFRIGCYFNYAQDWFEGIIDEVNIYSRALSADEIKNQYEQVVGHWHLDEEEGATAHDSSGNGNDGILTDMDPDTCWVDDGKIGGALEFDGIDDHIVVEHDLIGGLGAITLEVWVKGQQTANIFRALDNAVILHFRGAGFYLSAEDGTTSGYLSWDTPPPYDEWVHVVATWDGETMKLYQNGELQPGTKSFSGGTTGKLRSSSKLYMGKYFNLWQPAFLGSIDEVRIYSRALSEDEI